MKFARSTFVASLGAAAVLALASCSGSGAVRPQDSSAASAPVDQVVEQTQAAPAKVRTGAELEGIISSLSNAAGQAPKLVTAAELSQGQALQETALAGVEVTPAVCKRVANTNAELPEGSAYAAGSWTADGSIDSTVITLVSADEKLLASKYDAANKNRGACTDFTMAVAGQEIRTTMKSVPVTTSAKESTATLMTQDLGNGNVLKWAIVEARDGGMLATAAQASADVSEANVAQLAELVDKALAAS